MLRRIPHARDKTSVIMLGYTCPRRVLFSGGGPYWLPTTAAGNLGPQLRVNPWVWAGIYRFLCRKKWEKVVAIVISRVEKTDYFIVPWKTCVNASNAICFIYCCLFIYRCSLLSFRLPPLCEFVSEGCLIQKNVHWEKFFFIRTIFMENIQWSWEVFLLELHLLRIYTKRSYFY